MNEEILKRIYKPIYITEYESNYFENLAELIIEKCSDKEFSWYYKCILLFLGLENDSVFRSELSSLLKEVEEDDMTYEMSNGYAVHSVFCLAILYNCIINGEDKDLSSLLSLTLNTITFGNNNTICRSFVDEIKGFYRENHIESLSQNSTSGTSETVDSIKAANKTLKFLLNIERKNTEELTDVEFVIKFCADFAVTSALEPIFKYPEAYITKTIINSSIPVSEIKAITEIKQSISKIYQDFSIEYFELAFPILTLSIGHNQQYKLIDLAIEVYYEQMLYNLITENNYAE